MGHWKFYERFGRTELRDIKIKKVNSSDSLDIGSSWTLPEELKRQIQAAERGEVPLDSDDSEFDLDVAGMGAGTAKDAAKKKVQGQVKSWMQANLQKAFVRMRRNRQGKAVETKTIENDPIIGHK